MKKRKSRQRKKQWSKVGVAKIPTVQLYAGNGLQVDTFPCGPSKFTIFRQKLTLFVHDHVDTETGQLKCAPSPSGMATGSKTVTKRI